MVSPSIEYLLRPVLDRPGRYRVRLPVQSTDGRRIEPTHLRWAVACGNGLDDDGDGHVDAADPGCHNAHDRSERGPIDSGGALPVCANGLDDDGDGQIDWPVDPQCAARGDDAEGLATDERIFARFRGRGGRALVGPWRERRRYLRTPRSRCPRAGAARYTEVVVERPSRLEAAITHSDRPQSLSLRCDPSRSDAAREVTCTAAGAARLVVERIEPGVYPLLVIGAPHGRAIVEVRLEPL